MELQDKIDYAYSAYGSLGLSRDQVGGIIGSLMGESGRSLNTSSFNPNDPGRGSFGIANWNGSRWDGLESFAASRGKDVTDYKTQVDYSVRELQTTHKTALDKVKDATDSAKASKAWTNYYEKPQASLANHTGRAQNATYALGFMGTSPGKSSTGTMLGAFNPISVLDKALDVATGAMKGGVVGAGKAAAKSGLLDEVTDPIENALKDLFGVSRDVKDSKTGKTTGQTKGTEIGNFFGKMAGEPNIGAKVGAIAGGIFGGPQGAIIGGVAGQGLGLLLSGMMSPNIPANQPAYGTGWAGSSAGNPNGVSIDANGFPSAPNAPSDTSWGTGGYSQGDYEAAASWGESNPDASPGLW